MGGPYLELDSLTPSQSCVYDALGPILSSCQTPGDTIERTLISVRLTICELEAAGIVYPIECLDASRLVQCTRQLESRPTWWTSFSGNYQHISVVCYEYRHEYEADRVIRIFKGVNDVIHRYEQEGKESYEVAEAAARQFADHWDSVRRTMSSELAEVASEVTNINTLLRHKAVEFEQLLASTSSMFDASHATLSLANACADQLTFKAASFQSSLAEFEASMEDIHQRHLDAATLLDTSVNSTSALLESTKDALKATKRIIDVLTALFFILKSVMANIWFLPAVALVIFTIYKTWLSRSSARPNSAPGIQEPDPIFF